MKITTKVLKEMIQEEMNKVVEFAGAPPSMSSEESTGAPPEPEKLELDVDRVLMYIDKIDREIEYNQLLMAVILRAKDVPRGKQRLQQLYRDLPNVIKPMK